jgi:spermidine/putrescine transport system ATP-binding protein
MSDRIAVMFEGEIGQMADPETLYRRPNSKRVAEFIGKMNLCRPRWPEPGTRSMWTWAGLGRGQVESEQAPGGVISGRSTVGHPSRRR